MSPRDVSLALLVALAWGIAFVFTKLALHTFSAPQLVALRFLVGAGAVLFLPRPPIAWRTLFALGLTLFAGQFLFQFWGIAHGMPPGLASVVVQTQALFTVVLAAAVLGERPAPRELTGIALAAIGLACIAATVGEDLTLVGLLLTLVSPVSFAIGNIQLKRLRGGVGSIDMLHLMAWLSLVPPLPALALSLYSDGAAALPAALARSSWLELGAVLYLGLVSGTLAYAIWGRLVQRYSAAQVSPFALLVPFVASLASAWVLDEQFGAVRLAGMACVLAGLTIIVLPGGRVRSMLGRAAALGRR